MMRYYSRVVQTFLLFVLRALNVRARVLHCSALDAGVRLACQLKAWGEHKAACKAAVRARKKLEAV